MDLWHVDFSTYIAENMLKSQHEVLYLLHTNVSEAISRCCHQYAYFCYNAFEVNAALVPQGDTLDTATSACIWNAGSKTKQDFDFLLVQRKSEVTRSI